MGKFLDVEGQQIDGGQGDKQENKWRVVHPIKMGSQPQSVFVALPAKL
jgi:hypothetical protein